MRIAWYLVINEKNKNMIVFNNALLYTPISSKKYNTWSYYTFINWKNNESIIFILFSNFHFLLLIRGFKKFDLE